jgi:alginate O-acetylation protein
MLFNTPEYIAFFIVIILLFIATNRRNTLWLRNLLLLVGSYFFYAQLNWWFVLLLIYTTSVNFVCGLWISQSKSKGNTGRLAVSSAVLLSLAILVFFKYAYVFDSSIVLPVGLSFFTFQALTYSIDVYRGKVQVDKNILNVALFIAFFPTLLSGPIERARNLMPQLKQKTIIDWNNIAAGAGLFVWGLFKKVVIADRLAEYVNMAYSTPLVQSGSTLAVAAIFYSFQIYCDFSGYADMAIGSGRMLGFNLIQNFSFPYCVSTIKEFWRRWHISLTSWFTEYVYISMGGNRVSRARWLLNISTVFLLSGIWHGATWSFILWGAIHACLYLLEYYVGPKRPNVIYHAAVFIMVTFAWVFFRIPDSGIAWNVIQKICTDLISPFNWGSSTFSTLITIGLLVVFVIREWLLFKGRLPQKYAIEYMLLIFAICLFGVSSDQFVYFQF